MRYGIFGDVHGHLAAMQQALTLLEAEGARSCCVLYDSDIQQVRFLHFPTPKAELNVPEP